MNEKPSRNPQLTGNRANGNLEKTGQISFFDVLNRSNLAIGKSAEMVDIKWLGAEIGFQTIIQCKKD